MSEPPPFAMPTIPVRQWYDADGTPITYGQRWGTAGPPESAYSATSNTERFAPLHAIADALVEHLLTAFDCEVDAEPSEPGDVRAVLVRPSTAAAAARDRVPPSAAAAGIRIAWTDFPGVRARLGGEVDEAAPFCGCDACDEPLDDAARRFCGRVLDAVFASSAWRARER